ncbi:MAG: aminoacyl-tRNA hydrolase [Spirochaetaceae bacterium]|nr:aminoacyl-tRNA hydrolase [Spirochaetaceae bacterium]
MQHTARPTEGIKLVFFCGNPGKEYAKTRHNAAWMVLQELEKKENLSWQKKFKGTFAKSEKNNGIIFLKPEVYMNLAGESVSPALSFFKLLPENIIVCHDDIELDFGTVSLKLGGGNAGHNGLRSISKMIGTNDFYRFRIGVSRPAFGKVDAHVLGRFSSDEEAVLSLYMEKAASMLESFFINSGERKTPEGTKIKLLS